MARAGIYALIDEIKNAASPDEASGRIDRFVVDLGEDAKHYGWPQGKIATQQARLRKLIKATYERKRAGRTDLTFRPHSIVSRKAGRKNPAGEGGAALEDHPRNGRAEEQHNPTAVRPSSCLYGRRHEP